MNEHYVIPNEWMKRISTYYDSSVEHVFSVFKVTAPMC